MLWISVGVFRKLCSVPSGVCVVGSVKIGLLRIRRSCPVVWVCVYACPRACVCAGVRACAQKVVFRKLRCVCGRIR